MTQSNDWKMTLDTLKVVVDRADNNLPWCGDLAIQKVVYLLESVYGVDLGYQYKYHHMGPYSFELADNLSLGVQAGELSRQSKPISNGKYWVNQYNVAGELPADDEKRNRLESALNRMLSQFNEQNKRTDGRTLELVATIHFLRNEEEIEDEELESVLRGLKPKYSSAEFKEGLRQLEQLVQSANEFAK